VLAYCRLGLNAVENIFVRTDLQLNTGIFVNMYIHVTLQTGTDVSEESAASIFRVGNLKIYII
jgi:hypothetical protein